MIPLCVGQTQYNPIEEKHAVCATDIRTLIFAHGGRAPNLLYHLMFVCIFPIFRAL
jgi:hypothetical protein